MGQERPNRRSTGHSWLCELHALSKPRMTKWPSSGFCWILPGNITVIAIFSISSSTLSAEPDGGSGPLDSVICCFLCARTRVLTGHQSLRSGSARCYSFRTAGEPANVPSSAVQARKRYRLALRELSRCFGSVDDAGRSGLADESPRYTTSDL